MSVLTSATTVVNSPRLPPGVSGSKRGKHSVGRLQVKCMKQSTHFPLSGRGNPALKSTRRQSSILICASAMNARCAAEQTQTVTRKAPTMTHMPTKDKLPDLDDGGTGFPPRDDGDGGGGGGGNWSGGFFFFGFLAFLGFLKDKESEGPYQDNRKR